MGSGVSIQVGWAFDDFFLAKKYLDLFLTLLQSHAPLLVDGRHFSETPVNGAGAHG